MIVLNVRLDNFYAFKNFHLNLTYPKKIVNSYIKEEHLAERENFRYKKVNIFYGANASGKTTFGRILMKIFNFINDKNYEHITKVICDTSKEALFSLDLASDNNYFYRVNCIITPRSADKYTAENIKIGIQKEKILKKDSYESCVARINDNAPKFEGNYVEELEKIEELAWLFEYPEGDDDFSDLPNKSEQFRFVLESILKSLDPSIREVKISNDVENAYVIHFRNESIVLQNGQQLTTDLLSSGTKSGVAVSKVLFSLMHGRNRFYFCDEKFSYIHSEIEKAILALMIEYVGSNNQLFFTTHNTDILDLNLPKHSFTFLKKDVENEECPIICIDAASLLKRNTDSLRRAVENDLFSTAPAVELIYAIGDFDGEEQQ